jgi:ATP-dependent Zn protease
MKRPRSLFRRRERKGAFKADRPAQPSSYDPNDRWFVAVHEAGHAVAAVVLGLPLEGVDIRHRAPEVAGGVTVLGFSDTGKVQLEDIAGKGEDVALPHMVLSMAGPIAEGHVNRHAMRHGGQVNDMEGARRVGAFAICPLIEGPDGRLEVTAEELQRNSDRLRVLWDRSIDDAFRLVDGHRKAIGTVAALLLERESLSGDEVAAIVNGEDRPNRRACADER